MHQSTLWTCFDQRSAGLDISCHTWVVIRGVPFDCLQQTKTLLRTRKILVRLKCGKSTYRKEMRLPLVVI